MRRTGVYRTVESIIRNVFRGLRIPLKSRSRFRLDDLLHIAADQTDEGLIILSPDLKIVWINHGFMAITGHSERELLGCWPFDLLAASDTDTIQLQELKINLLNGKNASAELYLHGNGGRRFWMVSNFQAARDLRGNVTHFIGMHHDITQQRYMLDALRDSENRSRAVVDTALDAVITTDHHGMIVGWNPCAETMFGWLRREVLHQPLVVRIFPRETRTDILDSVHAILTGKACTMYGGRFEMELLRRNGDEFPAEISVSTMHGRDGIFVNMFIHDVSERRRAEEALRHAKEQAEAANKAKSDFLANMSHEIRTPLNGVIGMSELLLKTRLDEQQRRYVSLARTSADALLTLINEVLDFSKIEAGKMNLDLASSDIAACTEDVVEMLGPRAADRNLELACQIRPEARAFVMADANRVRQVLINLISNAIKFTPRGHVLVRLDAEKLTDTQVLLQCSIEDTGIGIPTDQQHKLFKSFSQIDSSSTRQYGGTGLGLAICKQLVELMGGQIGVNSVSGKGSTFWFKLPLERAQSSRLPVQIPKGLQSMRVLAVDDVAAHRMVLQEHLSGWGFHGELFADGKLALQTLKEADEIGAPFRLALVDLVMPAMDGLTFAAEVKKLALKNPPAMILMSGTHQHLTTEKVRAHGFAAFVAKPFRQSELLDTIVSILGTEPSALSKDAPVVSHANRRNDIRVLLAEDNEVNRLLAQEVLRQSGFTCDSVVNGLEAVEAVQRGVYDAVLMDCQMPQLDGFGATREIRRLESMNAPTRRGGGSIPIVALTANAIKGDREKCLEAGMNGYLTKPINAAELTRTLGTLLHEVPGSKPTLPDSLAAMIAADNGAKDPSEDKPQDLPAIKLNELLERCMGSCDLVDKVLSAFEKEALCELTHITELIKSQRTADAAKRIHSLKGSAGNIAAHELHKLATEMDRCAKQNNLAGMSDLLQPLENEINRCVEYVRERKNTQ